MGAAKITRRGFLGISTTAAASLLAPRTVGATTRSTARPRIGFIGLGGAGRAHLLHLLPYAAALCDVDADRIGHARSLLGRRVLETGDYRELVESPDIDAVVIASPDHWHAYQAVHACQAGKDLLLEPPLGATIAEARAVLHAVTRYGRVAQCALAAPFSDAVREAVPEGPWTCWHQPNPAGGNPEAMGTAPPGLDWDMWLGPAAWRPYNPSWGHYYFRWMMELGGGRIRQEGIQLLAAAVQTAQLDLDVPLTVRAEGMPPATGLWNCPVNLHAVYERDGNEALVWTQRPGGRPALSGLIGDRGNGSALTYEEGRFRSVRSEMPESGSAVPDMYQNWLGSMESRGKPLADVSLAYRATLLALLGNLAWRLGRPITWDPAAGAFVDDAQADRLIDVAPRGPWRL